MAVKAKYVGEGNYHNGVPARDLTEEDWEQLTPEQRDLIKESAFYKLAGADTVKASDAKPAG